METVGTERTLLFAFLAGDLLTLSGNKHQVIKVSWLLALQSIPSKRKSDLHTLAVMNLKGTEKPGVPGVFPLVIVSCDDDIFIAVVFSRYSVTLLRFPALKAQKATQPVSAWTAIPVAQP